MKINKKSNKQYKTNVTKQVPQSNAKKQSKAKQSKAKQSKAKQNKQIKQDKSMNQNNGSEQGYTFIKK